MPRLSINQWSMKTTPCDRFIDAVARAGLDSVGLWRQNVAEIGVGRAAKQVADAGLSVSTLCRGGFLTASTPAARAEALDDNRRAIDEAHALGTDTLVMVVGGLERGQSIREVRRAIPATIAELAPYARQAGVRLALEPMHPMFAADRAVISTLGDALAMATASGDDSVGVVVDTYHIWWDPAVLDDIARIAQAGRLLSYQVSDWSLPLASNPLNSRGVMGNGYIDFAELTGAVAATGYSGKVEAEIFNESLWAMPVDDALALVKMRFDSLVAPYL
ncbi:sugar phosphate isomerase/epimerase [Brooklawnia cerclae]|uniref:Sugar phosphate isomerase/epimerase n=1 Tax=Brooklawnia cerclae TaxID=349934 RepID=A0ABX0SPT6_9ACTN|nr:sugar phosphate isomerase/epimerase family protein [Brooklawnia cerclae]NIH58746.1 sugar phosphate isomerase/epimerase [Brooklawnia cerclae]